MATLLRARLLNQSSRCLSQINDLTSIVNRVKFDYNKLQVTCSHLNRRCIVTQKSENSEKLPRTVIYRGKLSSSIRLLKLFSLSTSLFGVVGWPLVYLADIPYKIMDFTLPSFAMTGITLYSLSTPWIMHIFTKRYIKTLEYDAYEDKYIATVYTLFCKEKQIEFKLEDVTRLDIPRMFTTIKVKGMPLFFDQYSFEKPEHCSRLLAYDQPIDFKLSDFIDENEREDEPIKERIKQQSKM